MVSMTHKITLGRLKIKTVESYEKVLLQKG